VEERDRGVSRIRSRDMLAAIDEVAKRSPAGVELLNLAAFLAPDDIPLDLLLAHKDELTTELRKAPRTR